ncbi:hypothetical protein ALC56_05541 [Trachymyrmex septentrionalis]|uniref:Uncharacterized protein n=1 Tax=Trachymyrmex septentrionalis TaxID=34720 RepID=A0A151JXR3_9HYME|nr:hypothetical protein ALC56_05541 [Trachymyrmex septentrionalis]
MNKVQWTKKKKKLHEEEKDVFDETYEYMGSIIDMVKQRKIDPNTIRMREAKTMKNALMSFLDALKTRGLLNSMYSMKDIESFLLYLREQNVKRLTNTATLIDAPNVYYEIFTLSSELTSGGMDALFASTSKQTTDGILKIRKNVKCELTHYIFTCPMPWRFLTKTDQSHASWLMTHHHGCALSHSHSLSFARCH